MIKGLKNLKSLGPIIAWGMYDLANQFFALSIVSLYFVRWVTIEKGAPEIFHSIFFAVSALSIAAAAPIMGAISDLTRRRRVFLVSFTLLSVVFTMMLGVSDNVFLGLTFFAIANFGCQVAVVFYNAILINIAPKNKIGLISGFGKMLGYAGAVIALYLMKPIVLRYGYQATFFPTGLLFLIFASPCLLLVKDINPRMDIGLISFARKEKVLEIFKRLKSILSQSSSYPGLVDFLKTSFFGMCAINAIIVFMAVYATRVFHMDEPQIIRLLMLSTVFAMAGSLITGYASDRLGALRMLMAIFILWGFCFSFGAFIETEGFYWFIGALVGVSLGSTWAVLRAAGIKLVSADMMGELFGLFNIVGYISGAVGAVFWGIIVFVFSPLGELSYRIALFGLNIFLVIGFVFLLRIFKLSTQ
ncbi:MAG TPA: MFS transporter [Candidatus Omnitrophica bacterium]|nr:MFS transporter [Candidatus Omnitrophota bacterium]